MGISNSYPVGIFDGTRDNLYSSNPQVKTAFNSQKPDIASAMLTKPQHVDTFSTQTQPIQSTYGQKILSNAEDRLLTRFFPEKFVSKYASKGFLQKAVENNPKIKQILAEHNLEVKISPENVTAITKSHLLPTMFYAKEIMDKSGEYYTPDDYEKMAQAALLHDIGKALIPAEILNKKGALYKEEREIVQLHNELGYEILKSSNLSPKVLAMVKNHHDYGQAHVKTPLTQILTVADIYSALKEKRSYKQAMSNEEAFNILEKISTNGEVEKLYVNALKASQKIIPSKTERQATAQELAIA